MKWLYYLHTNGDLIGKNPIVLDDPDYFDSDFVRTWWTVETADRGTLYPMIFTALAMGANKEKIKELATKWAMTEHDTFEYLIRYSARGGTDKDGLAIFIKDILGMIEDKFWEEFRQWMEERANL